MNKVAYNPTWIKLKPNWDCTDLDILPIHILCGHCKKPMSRGGMECDLGYGENKDRENSPEYEWLLLYCSSCSLEIAIPLRPVTMAEVQGGGG